MWYYDIWGGGKRMERRGMRIKRRWEGVLAEEEGESRFWVWETGRRLHKYSR